MSSEIPKPPDLLPIGTRILVNLKSLGEIAGYGIDHSGGGSFERTKHPRNIYLVALDEGIESEHLYVRIIVVHPDSIKVLEEDWYDRWG